MAYFTDHPRSRGEYSATTRAVTVSWWIIPALAGNTWAGVAQSLKSRDHPRSRGEYLTMPSMVKYVVGSSPLSRGIRTHCVQFRNCEGIIPALAGNTIVFPPPRPLGGDHPRSRGEYRGDVLHGRRVGGSSPLSRGIPDRVPRRKRRLRIIPALAGNTWAPRCPGSSTTDHPRSRGEYRMRDLFTDERNGSSPLSRGIRVPNRRTPTPLRIIPALAGNTSLWVGCWWPQGDHPRSRGEYDPVLPRGAARLGSSPLSRGIR